MRHTKRKRSRSRSREGASPHYSDTDSSSSSSSSDDEPEVDPAVEAERLRYVLYTCCHHAQPLIPLLTPSADVIKARIRELAASVGSLMVCRVGTITSCSCRTMQGGAEADAAADAANEAFQNGIDML